MHEESSGMAVDFKGVAPRPSTSPSGKYLYSETGVASASTEVDDFDPRRSSVSATSPGYFSNRNDGSASPFVMSPWHQSAAGAGQSSSWSHTSTPSEANGLIGSLVREEGHIYSLAASGELLYTGSDSKNIRVWKNREECGGFKSNSGLVKAIVVSGERIFTGHQDGRIRVWRVSPKNPAIHKRVGSLPTTRELLKCSFNPANYVEVRRRRNKLWIKHHDAVSCLSLTDDGVLLYSGSWDRTVKVWRVSDSRCLESIQAHGDAVNSVIAAGCDGTVITGSADGTVKAWRREPNGNRTKHSLVQTLLQQESAVTSLTVSPSSNLLYCGSSDGLVNFWDLEKTLAHAGVLRAHKLAVLCLSAAGSLLFTGSADKSICVWRRDGTNHSCVSVLHGHTGPIKCMAIESDRSDQDSSCDGSRKWILYTGSLDKSINVWRVGEGSSELMGQSVQGDGQENI